MKALNCTPNQNIWKIYQLQAALLRRASLRDIEIMSRDDEMLCNTMIHTRIHCANAITIAMPKRAERSWGWIRKRASTLERELCVVCLQCNCTYVMRRFLHRTYFPFEPNQLFFSLLLYFFKSAWLIDALVGRRQIFRAQWQRRRAGVFSAITNLTDITLYKSVVLNDDIMAWCDWQ